MSKSRPGSPIARGIQATLGGENKERHTVDIFGLPEKIYILGQAPCITRPVILPLWSRCENLGILLSSGFLCHYLWQILKLQNLLF